MRAYQLKLEPCSSENAHKYETITIFIGNADNSITVLTFPGGGPSAMVYGNERNWQAPIATQTLSIQ